MNRGRANRWPVVVIAAIVASFAQPAAAASIDAPPHARGPLDLKRLVATKHDAGAPLRVPVVTWETWPANTLDVAGGNRIFILFNSDHEGRWEYRGEVLFRDGDLWLRIEDRAGTFVASDPGDPSGWRRDQGDDPHGVAQPQRATRGSLRRNAG